MRDYGQLRSLSQFHDARSRTKVRRQGRLDASKFFSLSTTLPCQAVATTPSLLSCVMSCSNKDKEDLCDRSSSDFAERGLPVSRRAIFPSPHTHLPVSEDKTYTLCWSGRIPGKGRKIKYSMTDPLVRVVLPAGSIPGNILVQRSQTTLMSQFQGTHDNTQQSARMYCHRVIAGTRAVGHFLALESTTRRPRCTALAYAMQCTCMMYARILHTRILRIDKVAEGRKNNCPRFSPLVRGFEVNVPCSTTS